MAERSFKEEVGKLKLGDGEEFHGEGILAVTKALLQSGVSYVAGYQGAPISHLMDVLADANEILEGLGVHFENSASEATAAATLAASVNYPLRGAVTFKSTVGTNVASDALANLASGGVTGGALVIIGEDYGEGSSIMQERVHAFAMKSQMWLLDPRPNLPSIVRAVENSFELSEASNTPVMMMMRIRACHVYGRFTTKANKRARIRPDRRAGKPATRSVAHRHAADDLCPREGQVGGPSAGRAEIYRGAPAQRVLRRRGERHRHRRARRRLQHDAPRADAQRACRRIRREQGADLCDERHLSAGRQGVHPLLRRQEGHSDRRGRPAGLHRAERQHHPAPRRHPDPRARQGRAADGRRIHRRRGARRRPQIHREGAAGPAAGSAARRGGRPAQGPRERRRPRR